MFRIIGYRLACVVFLLLSISTPSWSAGKVVIAFGDSLTAGLGLDPRDAFPAQLEKALQAEGVSATVVNAGVSGDTTSSGRARLLWLLDSTAGGKPDLVLVELGANDALRGIDPAISQDNLDWILSILKERGIAVILIGMMAPPNLGRDYSDAFNGLFPVLAKKHNVTLYPFFLAGVAADPALNQDDGMHPNAGGVAVISDRMAPLVASALKQGR